ncbi:uncharacterized protein PV09_04215 [Verruconis gallopava]|uniref:LysM domain-containing protein n=1 Tax=Verruconis gallopava TaxID=253628 RepID=A0A0D2AF28_9PEZI|nr:uncharacterized protein PV09_04215 [Verruconis gallopava]KIW05060.1 hypothetical protein PV09_04215 [Verruconis gallopava]
MSNEACCTCAALLSSIPPNYDEKTEKPVARHERRLDCCVRAICARCTTDNPRFQTYCPFCQISLMPTALPQGLKDPPPYAPPADDLDGEEGYESSIPDSMFTSTYSELPQYSDLYQRPQWLSEKQSQVGEDVLHFVDPVNDSVNTLAIRYGVPADAIRKKNGIFQDNLLAGRKTILIPGEYYKGGISLSPQPIDGEEEELRKSKIRKWMVACKVHDVPPKYRYDVAILYLKQADYNLDAAIRTYKEDEEWAEKNPMQKDKGKAPTKTRSGRFGFAGGLTGQLG